MRIHNRWALQVRSRILGFHGGRPSNPCASLHSIKREMGRHKRSSGRGCSGSFDWGAGLSLGDKSSQAQECLSSQHIRLSGGIAQQVGDLKEAFVQLLNQI